MKLRAMFAKTIAKFSYWILKTFTDGGSSFPGKVAMKLDPNILSELAKNYRVVIITGTNGKTVTTALITQILSQKFANTITNSTGSNMLQGIVSTFVNAKVGTKHSEQNLAILEVDEASLRRITKFIKPELILVTNIFRDQLDRYGEIYTTYQYILEGARQAPEAKLILNGDLPLLHSEETKNPQIYYGFANQQKTTLKDAPHNTDGIICPQCEQILSYYMLTYSNLGDYHCAHCGFSRPPLTYQVDGINDLTPDSSTFTIAGEEFYLPVAGLYNIYNALAAYAVALEFSMDPQTIRQGLAATKRVFGRQEVIQTQGKEVHLNLIKNPVGCNQIIELLKLEQRPFSLLVFLNSQPADGRDISWIWDADFEAIQAISSCQQITVGGERQEDMKKCLEVAGLANKNLQTLDAEVVDAIHNNQEQTIYILTTYTALLEIREQLAKAGIIKERMQA